MLNYPFKCEHKIDAFFGILVIQDCRGKTQGQGGI